MTENDSNKLHNRTTTRNKINDTSSEPVEENKSTIKSCPMTFGKRRSYLETHEGDVNSIAFHPDGRFLASGGFDRSVAVHDVVATKCIKHFQGHQSAVSHVTYNPFGNLIISSSRDGTVKFWDTLSGICIRTIVPTLLVSKGSSINNSYSSTIKANKMPSSSIPSTFYSTTNPTSDHPGGGTGNTDFSSGEIVSTEMSADGRYLLVTPKLSAVRILDLRKGEVVSRINSSDSSYDNDYKRYKNKGTTAKNNNGGISIDNNDNSYENYNKNDRHNRNNSREIFSTLSTTPPFSKGSFSLAKRRDIFLQRACFCSEGSIGTSFFFS
jgi:WD40 repeat protein